MAPSTFDIVVLSSSPPDHVRATTSVEVLPSLSLSPPASTQRVAMTAMSPLQTSPRASPQRKTGGALKSGSKSASILEGSLRGFATARSLVAAADVDEELSELDWGLGGDGQDANEGQAVAEQAVAAGGDAEVPKPKPRAKRTTKPKTTRKRATVPTTSAHFAAPPTGPTAEPTLEPAAATAAIPDEPPSKAKAPKPRKPRAKKTSTGDAETQTTIKNAKVTKARVTKPKGSTKAAKAAKDKAADVVSAHFGETTEEGLVNGAPDATKDDEAMWDLPKSPVKKKNIAGKQRSNDTLKNQPLDLDEAVIRRRDWTPTRDTKPLHMFSGSAGKENDSTAAIATEPGNYGSLLSGYAYAHVDMTRDTTSAQTLFFEGSAITKKRRVELIDVPGNQSASRQSSPEKGKAPKKKPRTITDLVTEQYAPKSANVDISVTSDFFSAHTTGTTTKVPLNDTSEATHAKASAKAPVRKRSTSKSALEKEDAKAKPKSKKPSTKPAAKPKPIAEKLLSPGSALSRLDRQDVLFGTSSQLALDESPTTVRQIQQAMRESEADADFEQRLNAPVPVWPRLQKLQGKRSLWGASARNEDGTTLERQTVYLPEPDRTQDFPLLMDGSMDEGDIPPTDSASKSLPKVAPAPASAPILISSDLPTPPPTIAEVPPDWSSREQVRPTLSTEIDDFTGKPPPSNQHVPLEFLDDDFFAPAQLSPDSPPSHRPFPPRTSVSLGSPKRKRGRPPKTHSAIPQRVTASAPIPKKPPAKSKSSSNAPPTTPKRKSQDRFAVLEEILDSEDDMALSPTPPRVRRLEDSPPLQFTTKDLPPQRADDLVPVLRIPESHLLFANIKPTLFTRITALVRSLPPTTNPATPSWHEKILMYDAIVLEDFTAFLNANPTIRTFRKATQKQIKAWNKDLKTRGEEKMEVEEGDGIVLATEKEVEMWMLRGWCEEMSVCCVERDKRGRGGARKGLY